MLDSLRRFLRAVLPCLLMPACGHSSNTGSGTDSGATSGADGSAADGGGDAGPQVTYYQDAAPIFAAHCMKCHQTGGIGPFSLAEYARAKMFATSVEDVVEHRVMPPWPGLSDGSCGTFSNVDRLSDDEIATLVAWVEGGALRGAPVSIVVPPLPSLTGPSEYTTPLFSPERQGEGPEQRNETRCFPIDSNLPGDRLVTGYEVVPGNKIVQQVIAWVVSPDAPSSIAGTTNGAQLQALDAAAPDRVGWACAGGSPGEAISGARAVVLWGPGQGIVRYPEGSGIPIAASDRVVVQVQYDLDNDADLGKSAQTVLRFELAESAAQFGVLMLYDPFLSSATSATPSTLAAGQDSVSFDWHATFAEMGFASASGMQLYGVLPEMRLLGSKYHLTIGSDANTGCGLDVPIWDRVWQRVYFYQQPYPVTSDTQIAVRCDYDTSARQAPILPGWSLQDEMCLAALYVTTPN